MSRDKDREIPYELPPQAKQTWLGENELDSLPTKIELGGERKRQKNFRATPSTHSTLFSRLSFTPAEPPPPPSSLTLVSAGLFLSHFFPQFLQTGNIFYPFLSTLSLRSCHLGCWAQPCPAVGSVGASWKCHVHQGASPASAHRGHPAFTHCQHLGTHTPYTGIGCKQERRIITPWTLPDVYHWHFVCHCTHTHTQKCPAKGDKVIGLVHNLESAN